MSAFGRANAARTLWFYYKKINGVYHFLVQAKLECGNFDVMELAPTVQCLTGKIAEEGDMKPPLSIKYYIPQKNL